MDTQHTSFEPTNTPHTPMVWVWALLALCAFGVLVWAVWSFTQGPVVVDTNAPAVNDTVGTIPMEVAREKAYTRARAWHGDAELSQVTTLESGNAQADARAWRFIFVSPSRAGTGFVIDVRADSVSAGEEVAYAGTGAPMLANGKTKDEAIAEVRALPGYANVRVSGVEATYGENDRVWYWGVITDRGTISIRMAK